jgi:hypothetical protein
VPFYGDDGNINIEKGERSASRGLLSLFFLNISKMKHLSILALLLCAFATQASGQRNFTEQLTRSKAGEGKVTIHQSPAMEALVNGTAPVTSKDVQTPKDVKTEGVGAAKKPVPKQVQEPDSLKHRAPTVKRTTSGEQPHHAADTSRHQADSLKGKDRRGEKDERHGDTSHNGKANGTPVGTPAKTGAAKAEERQDDEDFMEDNTVDVSIKTYRRHIKVNGYRIQVYAGGNSRSSHLEADRMTRLVKEHFPDQPVYTHFYNPRWICRVGNFRSYEEANSVLRQMKATRLFREASIIRCKIQIAL